MLEKDALNICRMIRHCERAIFYSSQVTEETFFENEAVYLICVTTVIYIGEIANRISQPLRDEYSDIPWVDIIDSRNFLVHKYEKIKVEVLWRILQYHIPVLLENLRVVIKEKEIDKNI